MVKAASEQEVAHSSPAHKAHRGNEDLIIELQDTAIKIQLTLKGNSVKGNEKEPIKVCSGD